MNKIVKMMMIAGAAAALTGCDNAGTPDFKYTIDSFADLKVMRYQIPGWENLSLERW